AGRLTEDGQLTVGLNGARQISLFLQDTSSFQVVLLRLVRLPHFLEHPAELMPNDRLHRGFANRLQKLQRLAVALQRLRELAFRQSERAELSQVHALPPRVF